MVGPTMPPSFIALYAPPLVLAFTIFFILQSSSLLPGQPTPVATPSTPTTPNKNNDDFLSSYPSPLVVDNNAVAASPKFILVFLPAASPDPQNDQVPANEGTAVFGGHDALAEGRTKEASFSPSTTTITSPATSATTTTSPSSAKNHETFLDRPGDELERAKAVHSGTMTKHKGNADEHAQEEEKISTMYHRPPVVRTSGTIAHKPRPRPIHER
jgi:hypothetical protein